MGRLIETVQWNTLNIVNGSLRNHTTWNTSKLNERINDTCVDCYEYLAFLSPQDLTIIISVGAFCFLATMLGNTLIIITVWKTPGLQAYSNYLVVNKAISHLFSLIALVAQIMISIHELKEPVFLEIDIIYEYYFFSHWIVLLFWFSSVLTLLAITFDRYLGVTHPFYMHTRLRKAKRTNLVIWIVSICLNSILVYPIFWSDVVFLVWALSAIFALLFAVPMLVMTILYTIIIYHLWFIRVPGNHNNSDVTRRRHRNKRKVVILTIITVLVYFISWFPYVVDNIMALWLDDYNTEYTIYQDLFTDLVFVDAALFPWIYFFMNEKFRKALKALFELHCRQDVSPSYFTNETITLTAIRML